MAILLWNRHEYTFTPTSYSVDETRTVRNFQAGEMITGVHSYVDTAFNGTGGRTYALGISGTTTLFGATTDTDITTASTNWVELVGGAGRYANVGRYTFVANTGLIITFTAATGGAPTAGQFRIVYYVARMAPN